jgi:hypothetical protein
MNTGHDWWYVSLTFLVLLGYEAMMAWRERRNPDQVGRTYHVLLRQAWFEAVSTQQGSEVLAVQTIRNSLMSSTMIASTAALGLMGTMTLAAPSLHVYLPDWLHGQGDVVIRRTLLLALMSLLFGSLISAMMAMRYFNHAGYISAMPVGSEARKKWHVSGVAYLNRAGLSYSWSVHFLLLLMPVVACILYPAAGLGCAVIWAVLMFLFDGTPPAHQPVNHVDPREKQQHG